MPDLAPHSPADPAAKPYTVLVFQIGSLGDTLVSIPAYRAIRRHFGPAARILILHNQPRDIRAVPYQVLEGSGLVDGSLTFNQYAGRSSWKTWPGIFRKIRRLRPDAVVYVPPGERTARQVWRDRLFFRLCGIPRRIGFHAYDPSLFLQKDPAGRPAPVPHESLLRIQRLEQDGIPPDRPADFQQPLIRLPTDILAQSRDWLAQRYNGDRPFVAICPGANIPSKIWPLDSFKQIGARLIAAHDIIPLIVGGPAETPIGDQLLQSWGRGINAAGQFSVIGSAALLRQCRFLVGLDTGTTHLAAAVGTPCVVITADRNIPGQWHPLGDRHQILRHAVPCAGCGLPACNVPNHPCMTGITVDAVLSAISALTHADADLLIPRPVTS